MIYVLYATKVNIGGWATFTRHLVDSLLAQGQEVKLVKLGNRDEPFTRPFGPSHQYRNITLDTLVDAVADSDAKCIVAALGKHYVDDVEMLIQEGAKVVIHDTAESTCRMELNHKPWCIRKTLAEQFGGVFIRHPYIRQGAKDVITRRSKNIYATSRVDFDKNTTMILDANRLGAKIDIVGFENRLYTRFKVMPEYPEWKQSAEREHPYPRTGLDSFELLRTALAMVDLTDIKGDGGGTQYTFLEAWDAGAIPIIGEWWLQKSDDMQDEVNCFAIKDAQNLATTAQMLRRYIPKGHYSDVREAGQRRLTRYHAPKVIVPQVLEWLNVS